jgi:hypothetical protein
LPSSQKIVAQLFQRVPVLNGTQRVSLIQSRKRDRIGAEYDQAAGDFSAKGQMI